MSEPSAIVLAPEISYADLGDRLRRLGLTEKPEAMATPPILPGEPELGVWRDAETGDRLTYTFNPAVGLRVARFRGAGAARLRGRVAASVPVLEPPRIRELLASAEPRQVLLGLFAVGELQACGLADAVRPLCDHPDAMIAEAAAKLQARLAGALVERGADELGRRRRARPGHSAVFPHLGGPHERRQVLRWLVHDRDRSNDDVLAVLRSGLEDEDWEVRATAMLAAARLGATDLWREIKRLELPRTSRDGPAAGDRRILQAARKAVLEHLSGESLPELASWAAGPRPSSREDFRAHLRRCVAGGDTPWRDGIFLLIEALTRPLDEDPEPGSLPKGITAAKEGYRLAGAGLEWRWVAPLPHWLGGDDEDLPSANPIRRETLERGFLIAARPLAAGDLEDAAPATAAGELWSWEAAAEACRLLGRASGLAVRPPTPDEWEMASRGPDGRRHPWGNGMEGDPRRHRSPRGLRELFGPRGEWAASADGSVWLCGADRRWRCAARARLATPSRDEPRALRPVIAC